MLALAAVGLVAAAGCGSSGASKASQGLVTTGSSVPTVVANKDALRKQVTLTGCASQPGGWIASGAAVNPTKKAVSYTITVFFTNAQATVETYGKTTLAVPAHKSGTWSIPVVFAVSQPTVCVLRGVA